MGIKALLSPRLLERLHNLGLHYLFHLKSPHSRNSLGESWVTSSSLNLDRELSAEWNSYTYHLNEAGIRLQERPDTLIWTGGDKSGVISVRNIYKALAEASWPTRDQTWHTQLWKWNCLLKLKLFTWLLTENKILVWDILQSRGWSGPNRCILCKEDSETSHHLFVSCHFTRQVWHHVKASLNLAEQWLGPSTFSCFNSWCSRHQLYPSLPATVCWNVWLTRNAAIFDDKPPSVNLVTKLILSTVNRPSIPTTAQKLCRSSTTLPFDKAIAWFDGAAQLDGSLCGAGGHIFINSHTSYRWTLNGGQGTNTKVELLGAWDSLILA
jgi:hypothetical protein